MKCGDAPFCGVLTLQSGDGPNEYNHDEPSIHGLWPQVPDYGDSDCVKPEGDSNADVSKYMDCYTDEDFAVHEWQHHGICAASTPDSYFSQACSLATDPLSTMSDEKSSGSDINEMADALEKEGYEVWYVDNTNMQVELVVCAGSNTNWKFSSVSDFSKNCGK